MKYIQCIFITLFLLAAACATQATASDLHIYTQEYPPYNFWEDNRLNGTSTEIIKDVLDRLDLDIGPADIRLVPWARAYDAVLHEKDSAIFTIARTAEREKLFEWICPLACAKVGIIARKRDEIVIESLDDLSGYRLGVVRQDVGHQLIRNHISDKELDIANSSEANLLKLQAGRIHMFVYDLNVVDSVLHKIGQNPNDFETVHVLGEMPFCIAFNRDTNEALLKQFRQAFEQVIQESGLKQCR